ncbi:NAD(P)/FAD-dependent oxidoreductase [Salsipaludibacter albus]|uniref:NAD(P)/FAD-dependent oxidoreductase n=1 Tax=Salsipaludibacter albus TaxID=2849650 RepID=UPI001EE451FC|nr:NAD(P)/FAD-dependent oxidoreductase [Salsipaludibacter albus]MBY5163708.1 NAD(P)/FAD-dependent oxidoreductase [Salsipaludibacter albus]
MADGRFDVVVAGGGPAGAVTACLLTRAGADVVVLERDGGPRPRVGESLAPEVEPLLVELGAWTGFRALDPVPSGGTASAWGGPEILRHSHLVTPTGRGWHVDRGAFDRMLRSWASDAGATVVCGRGVTDVVGGSGGWDVAVRAGSGRGRTSRVAADVVVDATGRRALVGRRLGATRRAFDRLVAVASHVPRRAPAEAGAVLVETAPDGWWYRAPAGRSRDAVVLLTDADVCARMGLSRLPAWSDAVAATRWIAPSGSAADPAWGPSTVTAATHRSDRRGDWRPWLAVGDAALAVDPIAGSGIVRALRTGMAGADVVLRLLGAAGDDGHDGRESALVAHERALDADTTVHLAERAALYATERRFDTTFWRRRLAVVGSRPPAAPTIAAAG